MPLYSYQCRKGHTWDAFKPMDQHQADRCPTCGKVGKQIITGFHKIVFQPYFDEVTDTYYRDAGQKREHLRRLGLEQRK